MAVIPESWDEIDAGGSATTTLTLTSVALSGSNRALYIPVWNRFSGTVVPPSRGSDTFTEQTYVTNNAGGSSLRLGVWNSTNESQSSSANLSCGMSPAGATWGFQYIACSDVDQATRIENFTQNADHVGTGGVTPMNIASAVGDLVMDVVAGVNNIVFGAPSEPNQTERIASTFPSTSASAKMSTKPGEASASMGWNVTSGSDTVIHFAWNIPSASSSSAPAQVTGLNVGMYSAERFVLTWDAPVGDPAGYKIEVSENDADWTVHTADTGTTATEFYPGGYAPGMTRYWRVSGINASGTGTASASGGATIPSQVDQDSLALLDFSDPFLTLIPPYGDSAWTAADLQQILGLPIAPLLTQNQRPTANAGEDQVVGIGPVQLDGSGSTDPDGDPLFYAWTVVSAPVGSSAILSNPATVTPTLSIDLIGTYVVRLIVNDGKDNSAPDTVSITANAMPVANAGPDQTIMVGSLVQLNGSGSTLASNYAWTVIQIPTGSLAALSDATSPTPTFLVDLEGEYIFGLTVDDGGSPPIASDIDTVTITASELAAIIPMYVAAYRPPTVPGHRRTAGVPASTIELWKYPKDLYDVAVDWEADDVLPAGATALGTLTVVVKNAGGTDVTGTLVASSGVDGFISWAQLQAGTAGLVYDVILTQVFNNGQSLDRYVKIQVRNPRDYVGHAPFKYPADKYPIPVEWAGRRPRGNPALSTLITKAYDASDVDETSTYIAGSFVAGTIGAGYLLGGTGGESRLLEFAQEFNNGRKFHEYAMLTVEVPPA